MYSKIFIFLINIFSILYSTSAKSDIIGLPSTLCTLDDGDCLRNAAQEVLLKFATGIPEYNIKPMDPLFFDKVDLSSQNLKLFVQNVYAKGLRTCKVQRLEIINLKLYGQMICDLVIDGEYVMDGKLSVLPIKGQGKVHAESNRVQFNGVCDLIEYTGKDGKTHFKIKSFTHSYELKGKSKLNFENLFSDNEILRKGVNDLIEKNPEEIISIVGDEALKNVAKETVININHYFKALANEIIIKKN